MAVSGGTVAVGELVGQHRESGRDHSGWKNI